MRSTRKPPDFRDFLTNGENKLQLFSIIKSVWTSNEVASRLLNKVRIFIHEGIAFEISSSDGKSVSSEELVELNSNQEETDYRQILYLFYAKHKGFKYAVVRTSDTDPLFIFLYYASQLHPLIIYLDTGTGKHRRLINVSELADDLGASFCQTLLGFYIYTGEDANSAFRGKGKVLPLKKLMKTAKHQDTFKQLGNNWDISDDLINRLEEFVCLIYGFPRTKNVNEVRSAMLKKMVGNKTEELQKCKNIDLSKLPPCKRSHAPHCRRVNYRAAQFKNAHLNFPVTPHPQGHGWIPTNESASSNPNLQTNQHNILEPVWSEGPILPDRLIDLMTTDNHNVENDQDEDDDNESDESDMDSDGSDYDSE